MLLLRLFYTIINHLFHIEEAYIKFDSGGANMPATSSIMKWMQEHYGYVNIIMGIFISLWLKLFFRKYDYNFYEILILLCFVIGIAMLIFAVFALLQGIIKTDIVQFGGILGMVYLTWAIGQFFNKREAISYVKAFLLGMLTFGLLIIIIGVTLDLIIKYH